jgi:hypothetical protein
MTEITRSDVDEVVRSLLSNDAWTMMDNIEAEDKFGRLCAEVKSFLIDLELLADNAEDNRAQASLGCAA